MIHCRNCLSRCSRRFASWISLQPPALIFLVTSLATISALASKIGIVSLLRFTVVSLALAFLLSFPFLTLLTFLTLRLGASYLPDVHRCRRVRSRVPPEIVVGSLCQCPLSHVRFGTSHDLPREPLSRDLGKLLVRVPSQLLLGPLAGSLRLRRLCTVQRLSPRKRAWSWPTLAKPTLAKIGVFVFWPKFLPCQRPEDLKI